LTGGVLGHDTLRGGTGNDRLKTTGLSNYIVGGAGNDTISAGSKDTVTYGKGVNELSTNNGASFTLASLTPTKTLPNVAGAKTTMMVSDFDIGPNSLGSGGGTGSLDGVLSTSSNIGYNNLFSIENAYGIPDPVLSELHDQNTGAQPEVGVSAMDGAGQNIAVVVPYGIDPLQVFNDLTTFVTAPNPETANAANPQGMPTESAGYFTVDPQTGNQTGGFDYLVTPAGTDIGPGSNAIQTDPNNVGNINLDALPLPSLSRFNYIQAYAPGDSPTGLTPQQLAQAAEETNLDVEWAYAIAPMANIYLVQAASFSVADYMFAVNAAATTLSSQGGGVVSMSFSAPEFPGEIQYDDSIFGNQAYNNISFIASAGDTVGEVSYPAISPYVTSVGGTTLLQQVTYGETEATDINTGGINLTAIAPSDVYAEFVWGGATVGNQGTGSGLSADEPVPNYQASTISDNYPLEAFTDGIVGAPVGFGPGQPYQFNYIKVRSGVDVTMLADPFTGVAVYESVPGLASSGWEEMGGTSLSAPLFAGIVALANQQRADMSLAPLGVDLNPAMYLINNQQYQLPYGEDVGTTTNPGVAWQDGGFRGYDPLLTEDPSQFETIKPEFNEGQGEEGQFYDIGGRFGLAPPLENQGGIQSGGGYDQSSGWGSPDVNNAFYSDQYYETGVENNYTADIKPGGNFYIKNTATGAAELDFENFINTLNLSGDDNSAPGGGALIMMANTITYAQNAGISLDYPEAVSLTNIQTDGLGQPIYVPNNPINLSISKAVVDENGNPVTTPNVGNDVTYTITVTNAGPGQATSVVVDDAVPVGETLVSDEPSTGAASYVAATGVWTVGTLGVGASATLAYTTLVNAFAPITNTAKIASSAQQDIGTNLSASVTIDPQEVNLSITKVANNTTPTLNHNVIYTVTVANAATFSTATNITVTDLLPSDETYVSDAVSSGSFVFNPLTSVGTWTIPSLAAGAAANLSIAATVNDLQSQTNIASITGTSNTYGAQTDIGTVLSAAATVNPVVGQVDLSISKSVSNLTPNVGDTVTYSLNVSNAAGANFSTADNIAVSDVLPSGESLIGTPVTTTTDTGGLGGGSFDPNTGLWSIPELMPGARAALTYMAVVDQFAAQTNTATVVGATTSAMINGVVTAGLTQTNVSTTTVATSTINPQELDLVISKSVSNLTPAVNSVITYTVTLTEEAGFSTATNVIVLDQIPLGEALVTDTPSVGTYVGGVWTIPTLAAGATATLVYTVDVNAAGPQTNTAVVTNTTQTNDLGNLSATVVVNPIAAVDLSIAKVASNATPSEGSNVLYTVVVSNAAGYSPVTSPFDVIDSLPAGETLVAGSYSISDANVAGSSFNPNTGIWVIPSLASGTSVTLIYAATISLTAPPALTNTATITGVSQMDVGTQLSTSVTVNPRGIDLSIVKAASSLAPAVNSTVTYTITVANAGGYSTATNIDVTDALPAGESLVSDTISTGTFGSGLWIIPTLASGATATLTEIVEVTSLGALTNTATIISAAQPDSALPAALTSSITINSIAQTANAFLKVTEFTTNLNSNAQGTQLEQTNLTNLALNSNAQPFYTTDESLATATLGITNTLSINLVATPDASAADATTFTTTGIPLVPVVAGSHYTFGVQTIGTTGTLVGQTFWFYGTVYIGGNNTMSLNGGFFRTQGLNASGQPIPWGKNGPTGGGGDFEGQFETF